MGEAKRRKQLLGDAYGQPKSNKSEQLLRDVDDQPKSEKSEQLLRDVDDQPKPEKINVNGEEVGLTYLAPGSEDWAAAEDIKLKCPNYFYDAVLVKNIRIDLTDRNLVGAVKFVINSNLEICVGAIWLTSGKQLENRMWEMPYLIVANCKHKFLKPQTSQI
ncbi:MAG: hypothetical protein AAFY21_01270 [Cyanobacteria bacterium J06641_2]